jgi:hypothetical protein
MAENDTIRKVHLYYVLRDILKQHDDPVSEQNLVLEVTRYDKNYTQDEIRSGLDYMYQNNDVVPRYLSGARHYSLR